MEKIDIDFCTPMKAILHLVDLGVAETYSDNLGSDLQEIR
jgi:hypothetical protein